MAKRRYKRYKRRDEESAELLLLLIVLAGIALVYYFKTYKSEIIFYGSLFLVLIVIIVLVLILRNRRRKKRRFEDVDKWHSDRDLLNRLRSMHPTEFEEYIADLYRRLGYKTEKVGGSYDGGIDVIATKNGVKLYIQCKKHIKRKAGVHDIRDFYGAMAGKLSKAKGIFITTNIFTTEAEKFAEDKPIELIDHHGLIDLIRKSGKNKEEINVLEERKCSLCDGKLIERKGKHGIFLGCSNYPKCKYTENINK